MHLHQECSAKLNNPIQFSIAHFVQTEDPLGHQICKTAGERVGVYGFRGEFAWIYFSYQCVCGGGGGGLTEGSNVVRYSI